MPFRLINAPTTFQQEMKGIFQEKFGNFVIIFFDDILVYIYILEKHGKHVRFGL